MGARKVGVTVMFCFRNGYHNSQQKKFRKQVFIDLTWNVNALQQITSFSD